MHSHRLPVLILLMSFVAGVAPVIAQDVVAIGSGNAPSGGAAAIPISLRDVGATPLGMNKGSGNRIQGFAFKVMYPTDVVASVTFARAGVTAAPTPMFETSRQGTGWTSFIIAFNESSNPIAFNLNALAPGDVIGTLTVTVQSLAPGTTATLTIDPPSAMLSNQTSSVHENVANGNLALVNGSVTVVGALTAPANLVATAVTTSNVSVSWAAVAGANHYELWRSFGGGAFALAGTSSTPSFSDTNVVAGKTYLYRVRAADAGVQTSPFSNIDAATTVFFTDDPIVANSTAIKAIHVSELRTAVNAMREAASLAPLAADATVATGAPVRAHHISDLRTGLTEARSAAGLTTVTFTDGTLTAGSTLVKAIHVQQLRDGVK